MAIRDILKMGDPRLLRQAEPVTAFDTPELHALIEDLFDTMYAANGAGLAAPQIGVNLQVVIFGFKENVRYPDARDGAAESGARAAVGGNGRGLGRLPFRTRPERQGAPSCEAALPRGGSVWQADRARGRWLPCAGSPA